MTDTRDTAVNQRRTFAVTELMPQGASMKRVVQLPSYRAYKGLERGDSRSGGPRQPLNVLPGSLGITLQAIGSP